MGKFTEYIEMAKRSQYSIAQNLEGDTVEDAVKDYIRKSKRSKYSDEEIIKGLMKAFSISKAAASRQLNKYIGK